MKSAANPPESAIAGAGMSAWNNPTAQHADGPPNSLTRLREHPCDAAARGFLSDPMRRDMTRTTVLLSAHDHDFIADAGASPVPMEALFGGRFNAPA